WVSLEIRDPSLDAEAVREALGSVGVVPDALLADHWFVAESGAGPAFDALKAAGLVTDPGAAVDVSLAPGVIALGELTFAGGAARVSRAGPAHAGVTIFARNSPSHFWIGTRSLAPGRSLVGETQAIMAAIAETMRAQGWRFESVTKATTHYV